jgi:8-oxo-dGDP phosphatase
MTTDNPWQTLSRRTVYANPWISVREDEVIRPDGADGIYGVVEFHNLALGVVPVFPDGDTVLVGQFRYALDTYLWEIPSGGGDRRRDPVEELHRELREETGLTASRWTPLGAVHTSTSATDEFGLLYLAEDLVEGEPTPEGTEKLAQWRLPLDEALAMALDGRLTDAVTVMGVCRAAHALAGREVAALDPYSR